MLATNPNYAPRNNAVAKQPVYVVELMFAAGTAGVDGTNDVYFATCDVNSILNFPYPAKWFPVLKHDSISSMSQQVDPINGVSTIGNINLAMTDFGGYVSAIIQAASNAGHGLRRQRISISMLFKGMDWADRVTIRTMQVQDLKLSSLNEYTLTASDIQRNLTKTVFNPFTTTTTGTVAASGAVSIPVVDARQFLPSTSVNYGSSGFIKIDSEIMRWTGAPAANSFSVASVDRGLFGTTAAAHNNGATVTEIVYLNENPITMILKIIESSGVANANGAYDAYPAHWGCNMGPSDVMESDWLKVGQLLTGLSATPLLSDGLQFEFIIGKGIEAKKFIEDSILKLLGAYGFVRGDGRYSVRPYNDLANAAKENAAAWLTTDAVVKWGDLQYRYQDLANQLWIDYDEEPKLSGKYIRSSLFLDPVSIKKWGNAKQLKYQAQGVPPTSVFINQLYQRFQRVLARYSRPPMQIQLTLLPKWHLLEIGDMVRVTLPIRDLNTGLALDRAFEIIAAQLLPKTGEVQITCLAQPELANLWFQGVGAVASVVISPAAATIPVTTTQQLVARCFDASGTQVQTPAISWIATGGVTVDANGLVTAGGGTGTGSVYAVVGTQKSNVANFTVTAAANTNPVSSVAALPSSVNFAPGNTQQAAALAYDAAGVQITGKTFNWVSSNPAVATVSPTPSAAPVITAVANGSANITAQETGSLVTSPAIAVAVAAPATATYTPPPIADAVYKVGTQITSMGAPGGPHTIPNGYNFAAGDYWFDGNVTLPNGSTCTINGTVRIFSLGTITINGLVNGAGRGPAGAAGISTSYPYRANGQPGTIQGFCGNGGNGGGFDWGPVSGIPPSATPEPGAPGLNQVSPILNVIGTAVTSGSWSAIAGLPTVLAGSQSAGGGFWAAGGDYSCQGGAAGAGLMLMGRGIYVTTGSIDLSGLPGVSQSPSGLYLAGSGGGGGGSFVGLAERNSYGLPVMAINLSAINTTGGAAGSNNCGGVQPTPGGTGATVAQVIG